MPSASWLNGWLTGDIVNAAEFRKGIGSAFDSTLGADAANIDFQSIPSTYAHLLLVVYARSALAATADGLQVQFNGDTAANYDQQFLQAAAATVTGGEAIATTAAKAGRIPGSSAPANKFGTNLCLISNYANSTNHKTVLALASSIEGTTTGTVFFQAGAGGWRSTAAINRVTISANGGNLKAGSRATLYVMGA